MIQPHSTSRRKFLRTTAAIAATTTLPHWYLNESIALAADQPAPSDSPGNKPNYALIGCGGMGKGDAKNAQRFGNLVAVCDVDAVQLAAAQKQFENAPDAKAPIKIEGYSDFRKLLERKDVDAVICATVDHWHVLVSMAAMKAGKDVYCEKPLTLTIDEGKRLVAVQKQTGRVLQTGTQQRSSIRFRLAHELILNGRIGKVKHVDVWLPSGRREGPFKTQPVPEGFDWNMWQGQTPYVDYVRERTHLTFRYWWEYSGGTMTDWGAHHNDIVVWTLGMDRTGPASVEGKSLTDMIPGGFTAASEYDVLYTYDNGITHRCRSTPASAWHGGVIDPNGQPHGIRFEGTDGWLWVTRDKIDASNPEILKEKLPENAKRTYMSNDHMGNFFDCVKSRKAPIAEAEIGHRSASACHMGVIAIRLGRKLQWDAKQEEFINDAEANTLLQRPMRKPWDYTLI